MLLAGVAVGAAPARTEQPPVLRDKEVGRVLEAAVGEDQLPCAERICTLVALLDLTDDARPGHEGKFVQGGRPGAVMTTAGDGRWHR